MQRWLICAICPITSYSLCSHESFGKSPIFRNTTYFLDWRSLLRIPVYGRTKSKATFTRGSTQFYEHEAASRRPFLRGTNLVSFASWRYVPNNTMYMLKWNIGGQDQRARKRPKYTGSELLKKEAGIFLCLRPFSSVFLYRTQFL